MRVNLASWIIRVCCLSVCCLLSADSDVMRDRPTLWRSAVAEIDFDLVDETPTPTFGRIVAFNDRVARSVIMLGGVPMRRAVAATDTSTASTQAQVHPLRPDLQTL